MLRAALAVAVLSAWVVVLFSGWVGGGAAHLLLVAALLLFPWRAALSPGSGEGGGTQSSEEERS